MLDAYGRVLDAMCIDAEEILELESDAVTIGRCDGLWVVEMTVDDVTVASKHDRSPMIAWHLAIELCKQTQRDRETGLAEQQAAPIPYEELP